MSCGGAFGDSALPGESPDRELQVALGGILERPGGWLRLAALLAEVIGVHLQRGAIGRFIRKVRSLGQAEGPGCDQHGAGLLEPRPGADLENEPVALLHELHLGIGFRQNGGAGFSAGRFRASVIDISTGLERLLATIVAPQPETHPRSAEYARRAKSNSYQS